MEPVVTGMDYSSLTAAVDFTTVGTGVLAVAAALAGIYVGIRGAKILVGFVRGR